MSTDLTATFEVKGWDENPQDEGDGLPKITRASVTKDFSGDIEGSSALEYLMVYAEDGTAAFVGLERFKGTVKGRSGSFVLQHVGRFEDGAAKAALTVAPGSGTSDLKGLTGSGDFTADPKGSVKLSVSFGG
ncbi:MAG: DUF3224 domain-containing protein [Acidimicrobiales bacterium]